MEEELPSGQADDIEIKTETEIKDTEGTSVETFTFTTLKSEAMAVSDESLQEPNDSTIHIKLEITEDKEGEGVCPAKGKGIIVKGRKRRRKQTPRRRRVVRDTVDSGTKRGTQSEKQGSPDKTVKSDEDAPEASTKAVHKRHRKNNYFCETCLKAFTSPDKLANHEDIHKGVKQFLCNYCGDKFTQLTTLNQHERLHRGDRPFQCQHCGKSYVQKSGLDYHVRSHTGEKPYGCKHCDKKFSSGSALKYHSISHVPGALATLQKKKPCPMCKKSIGTAQMSRHLKCHSNEKSFKCEFCPKAFNQGTNLKIHRRIHTGDRPYTCKHCPKTFIRLSNLEEHERTHTGVKPFTCKQCQKCFAQISTLSRHERTHTQEKPYACQLCGKKFTQQSGLSGHNKVCKKRTLLEKSAPSTSRVRRLNSVSADITQLLIPPNMKVVRVVQMCPEETSFVIESELQNDQN